MTATQTSGKPRIFLSAGEASGDAYGAALITALHARLPNASFTGLGGTQMETAGQHRIVRAEDVAHMGITEVLLHAPFIYRQYRKLVRSIQTSRPTVAVLIDFPDVNFRLAKHLARAGVPVVWFVSPQLWAWKRARIKWVQQFVNRMLVIFPFEEPFYQARGVDAEFVGHPLATMRKYPAARDFDTIAGTQPSHARSDGGNSHTFVHPPHTHKNVQKHHPFEQSQSTTREHYAVQHNLDPERTWIALLPGSRWKEIRANLPALHELAVRDLIASSAAHTTFDGQTTTAPSDPASFTRYEFLLPVASTIDTRQLQQFIAQLDAAGLRYFTDEPSRTSTLASRITLVHGPEAAYEALHHARASVVASGTATVLAAIVGNPFLVVYRVSALTFALAKKLVAYPEEVPAPLDQHGNLPVAMVNLIAGQRIVPELLQDHFTAENVAAELAQILSDTPARAAQIAALAEVRTRLAAPGSPIDRVAATVLSFLT